MWVKTAQFNSYYPKKVSSDKPSLPVLQIKHDTIHSYVIAQMLFILLHSTHVIKNSSNSNELFGAFLKIQSEKSCNSEKFLRTVINEGPA